MSRPFDLLLWTTNGSAQDVALAEGMQEAVILSLFCDRRAEPGDVAEGEDPRGSVFDRFLPSGDRWGSRLWLLAAGKRENRELRRAEHYAREALAWLVEARVADRIEAQASWADAGVETRLQLAIGIYRGAAVEPIYDTLWQASLERAA